ncbi:MAG: metallophosphoesterase [Pseudomonadota bacterium]
MKLAIYYASYAYWPAAVLLLVYIARARGARRWFAAAIFAGLSVLAYARFVEPRMLTVVETEILIGAMAPQPAAAAGDPVDASAYPSIRIALFGDPHIGVFGNAIPIETIIGRINQLEVDAVLVAGDFVYHPSQRQIDDEIRALAEADAPVYAVLGNHDVGFPGPDLSAPVLKALDRAGVTIVENRAVDAELGGHVITIAGASDLWQDAYDFEYRSSLPDQPTLLLTHNPDTAAFVPADFEYDLMLAGHTHGGQIRLPGLYQDAIPTDHPFDLGLHTFAAPSGERRVFVTPGTGMVGLPFRFLMPPRIDVLTLRLVEEGA